MRAKDTVMNFDQISDASLVVFADEGDEEYHTHLRVAKGQAEISFKMGYNQALKDIADGLSPSCMV